MEGLNILNLLEQHTYEVILITFQSGLAAEDVLEVFQEANLHNRLHRQLISVNPSQIDRIKKTNIIVFSDRSGQAEGYYHDQWTYWIDNYSAQNISDFACQPDRGNLETASLYNLNHFITDPIAFESRAIEANQFENLETHALRCIEETGFIINQILVDFWSIGMHSNWQTNSTVWKTSFFVFLHNMASKRLSIIKWRVTCESIYFWLVTLAIVGEQRQRKRFGSFQKLAPEPSEDTNNDTAINDTGLDTGPTDTAVTDSGQDTGETQPDTGTVVGTPEQMTRIQSWSAISIFPTSTLSLPVMVKPSHHAISLNRRRVGIL